MNPESKYRSRKFLLAVVAMAVSAYALIVGIIDGNAWFMSVGAILGLYGGTSVWEKKQ